MAVFVTKGRKRALVMGLTVSINPVTIVRTMSLPFVQQLSDAFCLTVRQFVLFRQILGHHLLELLLLALADASNLGHVLNITQRGHQIGIEHQDLGVRKDGKGNWLEVRRRTDLLSLPDLRSTLPLGPPNNASVLGGLEKIRQGQFSLRGRIVKLARYPAH